MSLASLFENEFKIEPGEKWDEILHSIKKEPGTVAVLGGVDTGKSTLIKWLAKEIKEPCSYMELDSGQPDIGLPSCLAFKKNIRDSSPPEIYFTGDFSPTRMIGRYLGAISALSDMSENSGIMLINTCGWVDYSSFQYKIAKFQILKPEHLVFILPGDAGHDLAYLYKYYRRISHYNVYDVRPSNFIKPRDSDSRRLRRNSLLERYFKKAQPSMISSGKVVFEGEKLTPGDSEKGLLIGLLGKGGATVGLGSVTSFDPDGMLEFMTPALLKDVVAVRTGRLRLER